MSLSAVSPVLAWFLLGILLFALELALPGMIVFFFGVGAWCAALAVFLLPMSLASQLLVFLITSLVALVLLPMLSARTSLCEPFISPLMSMSSFSSDRPLLPSPILSLLTRNTLRTVHTSQRGKTDRNKG